MRRRRFATKRERDLVLSLHDYRCALCAGRPKNGEAREIKNQVYTVNLNKGGNRRAYILARLERDGHAELAAKVRAETMSAAAAAIQAGFRKKLTLYEQVLRLLPKLTAAERQALRRLLDEKLAGACRGKSNVG
jgi:hypothetical protein